MLIIKKDDSLTMINNKIEKELEDKVFWGQIGVSKEDLDIIKKRIKFLIDKGAEFKQLFKDYPVAMVSYVVFLTKYYYNGDFWGMISEEIAIDKPKGNDQSQIGRRILQTFNEWGFDYSPVEDVTRIYVDAVLYEIGEPPESNLGDLFYIFKYGFMSNADPQVIIDEIISGSYMVHKPLLHFLEDYPEEISLNFVLDMQDTFLSATQEDDVSGKYATAYSDWYDQDKEKLKYKRKKDDDQVEVRPYFSFDNGKKGLCIVLPRQIMEEEWVESAKWIIAGENDNIIERECFVQGEEGKRFTEHMSISVRPCSSYIIQFEYDDGFGKHHEQFILNGIDRNGYMYFSSNGRKITQRYLRAPYGFIIFHRSAIISANHVERDVQSYPLLSTDYRVEQIIPVSIDSEYIIHTIAGEDIVFQMKPQITLQLYGKKLFGADYIDTEIPVYTNIPQLIIGFQGFNSTEGIEIHIGDKCLAVEELEIDEETSVDISAGFEMGDYGIKTVRVYQFNRFLKQERFCLLPDFKCNYDNKLVWPGFELRKKMYKLRISKIEGWEFTFINGYTQEMVDKYIVSIPYTEGSLCMKIESRIDNLHVSVDLALPVCACKIELISETEIPERCDLTDYLEGEIWASISFFGDYRDYDYIAELISANGNEQKERIKLNNNGVVNLDMNVFRDTIQSAPLPVKISIRNNYTDETINVLVIDEVSKFRKRPGYANKSRSLGIWNEDISGDISVEKYGDTTSKLQLNYDESKLDTRGWRVFRLNEEEALSPGYYRINRDCVDDDLFPVNEEFSISLEADQFYVAETVGAETFHIFRTWLEQVICELIKNRRAERINDLKKSESYKLKSKITSFDNKEIDDDTIMDLVVLAQMLEAKLTKDHKGIICELMNTISSSVLKNHDRYRLIKRLVALKVDDHTFDRCQKYYNLILMEYPNDEREDSIRNTIGAVKLYSPKMAMLMLMKLDLSIRETLSNVIIRDIIGQDAIVEMMTTNEIGDEANEDRKHFIREDGKSKVHICITKEISGENRFYEMIDEERSRRDRIYLDKKKIPEDGIYLNGSRYTDLFVNWYIRNHPGGGTLDPQLDMTMKRLFEEFKKNVWYGIAKIKKTEDEGEYLREYDSILMNRATGGTMSFCLPNYFYFVAVAALIVSLSIKDEYSDIKHEANIFLINSLQIAPYITERDYIMASLYLFLRRKES